MINNKSCSQIKKATLEYFTRLAMEMQKCSSMRSSAPGKYPFTKFGTRHWLVTKFDAGHLAPQCIYQIRRQTLPSYQIRRRTSRDYPLTKFGARGGKAIHRMSDAGSGSSSMFISMCCASVAWGRLCLYSRVVCNACS